MLLSLVLRYGGCQRWSQQQVKEKNNFSQDIKSLEAANCLHYLLFFF